MAHPKRFITLEGLEGVGKSTQVQFLARLLKDKGRVTTTREPGGTPLGEVVRGLVLESAIDPVTEVLLIFAARCHHLQTVIKPALSEGNFVICDRFTDTSFAYQGGGRGLDMHDINFLEQLVQGELQPDVTLLLDAPIELSMKRLQARKKHDRFEQEAVAFFERARTVFLARAQANPQRYTIIDASQSLKEVQEQISHAVLNAI